MVQLLKYLEIRRVLIFLLFLGQSFALKCFLCDVGSVADLASCPQAGNSAKVWSADETKYKSIGAATDISCAVGYSIDSGKIYLQSGIPKSFCDDSTSTFKNTIILKIAKLGDTGGAVICCTEDGCNWNATTAQNNQNYGDITNSLFYIPDIVNWTPIILGAIFCSLLLICPIILCCVCCCCYKTQKKKQTKDAARQKPFYPPPPNQNPSHNFQPTPTKQIGVRPHDDLKPSPKPAKDLSSEKPKENRIEKPVKNPDPPKKNTVKEDPKDLFNGKGKDLFDKEQGHWAEIWRNANDPNFNGPISKKKSKYEIK